MSRSGQTPEPGASRADSAPSAAGLHPGALVLDMDGLMVDSEPLWHEVECAVAAAHGGRWTEALSVACIGTGLANTARKMRVDLGLDVEEERVVDELVAEFVRRVGELELKPGCRELLAHAGRRVPVALASSSTSRIVHAVLDHFDLGQRFAVIVTGSSVARPKPAPDIFLLASDRLAVPPSRCVVLEDSLAGVMAARDAGMIVIAVPEAEEARFVGLAHHVVSNLHEARGLLAWSEP